MVLETTSTMSRLFAPSSFIDRDVSTAAGSMPSTARARYLSTVLRICSRVMVDSVG